MSGVLLDIASSKLSYKISSGKKKPTTLKIIIFFKTKYFAILLLSSPIHLKPNFKVPKMEILLFLVQSIKRDVIEAFFILTDQTMHFEERLCLQKFCECPGVQAKKVC